MSEKKRDRVYKALVDAAYEGLAGEELRAAVINRFPKTSDKLLISASLLALSDPDLADPGVLRSIFSLAIARRTAPKVKNLRER